MIDIIDYLETNIDQLNIKEEKGEATGVCPFCGKGKEHFSVHIGAQKLGKWHCFSCGEGSSNIFKLIAHLEGISEKEALSWWLSNSKETIVDQTRVENQIELLLRTSKRNDIDYPLPDGFVKIKKRIPNMLRQRNIKSSTIRDFGLGFCKKGTYNNRIVFPINCPLGKSWTARTVLTGIVPKYWAGPRAGSLLFGWDVALKMQSNKLIVCEGPMDVLSLYQAGIPAVALMTKTISLAKAALIRNSARDICVILDSEVKKEAVAVARMIGRAKIAFLEEGDPGDNSSDILLDVLHNRIPIEKARCEIIGERISELLNRAKKIDFSEDLK
jgi:DNA primase